VASTGPGSGVKGQALLNTVEEIPYELKLNITDSEIVVVEDTSQWDTNAVILKVTRVLFCDTSQAN
jgi:vacuolar protein sorting-associated protein 13D